MPLLLITGNVVILLTELLLWTLFKQKTDGLLLFKFEGGSVLGRMTMQRIRLAILLHTAVLLALFNTLFLFLS